MTHEEIWDEKVCKWLFSATYGKTEDKSMSKDPMGDRLKGYESLETSKKFDPTKPVYARIDGRGFSKLTKGLHRPYDEEFSRVMQMTVKALVDKTNAKIGYTQSDEISLVWFVDNENSELFFGGKIQKMCSVLSALTTSIFISELLRSGLAHLVHKLPHFDCRVFSLPSETEAANTILWRERDATKNAISMAARSFYSHKALQDKSGDEMKEMIREAGFDFESYPAFFKRGTFVQRKAKVGYIEDDVWNKIPEDKKPESRECIRSHVELLDLPSFATVTNREDVIFRNQEPIVND